MSISRMQSHFGVLFLLGILAAGDQSCDPCTCNVGGSGVWPTLNNLQTANCSNLHALTSVPTTLPQNTQGLNIEYCYEIKTLKQNQFASLPNLQVIYVRIGALQTVESHAFRGATKARYISLDHNELTDLPTDLFTDTPNVVRIDLYANKLTHIRRNMFANLKHLEYVDLSINQITIVDSLTFVNVPALETVFLNQNQLSTLSLDFIDNTCPLKYLHLHKNPWQCAAPVCGVMEMEIRREMWTNWGIPECSAPSSLQGKTWEDLKGSALVTACHPTEHCNGKDPKTVKELNVTGQVTPTISANAFSSYYILEILYLVADQISTIQLHAFQNLERLSILSLASNNLIELQINLFVDTPSLTKLFLNNNKFIHLKKSVFINLVSLTEVDFSFNTISVIDQGCFQNVPSLQKINLSNNQLQTLQLNIIVETRSLIGLYLHGNPWRCDRSLCEVMNEVVGRGLYSPRFPPACVAPPALAGKLWTQLPQHKC